MGEQTKNMLIGVFVIVACALIVWLILFLKPGVGDGKELLYIRFSNVNRINVGTRVLFAGKPVGEVIAVDEIFDARQNPSVDHSGNIYYYQLTLRVDSSVKVFDTDEVTIQTSGLLGEKSIAILPKSPIKGVIPRLISHQPIYAESTDPIENAFSQLSSLANEMKGTFQQLNCWLEEYSEPLGTAVTSFGGAMNEVKQLIYNANSSHLLPNIQTMICRATQTIGAIQYAIDQLNQTKTFSNAGVMIQNLTNASYSIDLITKEIKEGTGTLGRLIAGDDLYLRMTSIMSKAETLMNDLNHYGLLFHLNKSWQRQRSQRITTLNALHTPDEFKQYFETEVDQINTAMSRLSLLIDRAQVSPQKENILDNAQFQKDFSNFLRQANTLSDTLKLYNQQLVEQKNH